MSDSASDDDEFDLEQPKLEKEDALMYHVVLPRVLPDKSSEFLHETESNMINYMVKNALAWERYMPPETLKMLRKLRSLHYTCKLETVRSDINNLKPGESFAIFVRAQHCGMMIHVPPNEMIGNVQNVIVSTFPGRLDAKEIYSHDSDIEFNYPERAINVKFSQMLRSPEFSEQLCVLSENLPVGYKRLDCVSKWLITLLMDEESAVANETDFPIITKKIRDEAWGSIEDNFRRSSFYLSIKAMIQHSFRFQLGIGAGKLFYKIFMLKFLVDTCEPYKTQKVFNIDLLSQVIAKLARRIEKLSTMMIADDIENLYDQTIHEAKRTIKIIRQKIDKQIKRKYKLDAKSSKLPVLKCLDLKKDSIYNIEVMKELNEYLKKREQNATDETVDNGFKPPVNITYERYFKYTFVPDIEIAKKIKIGIDQRIFWMDFERVVLHEFKLGDDRLTCKDLRSWSFEYAKFAEKSYKNNPLFISRMLLVRLKLIAMLDDQATKKYPMLLQHKSGVNENMINHFLLPQSTDMRHAYELEKYFRDRNEDATDPSLIGQKQVSDSSFAVKFARDDVIMQQIRNEILDKDNENVEKRRADRNKLRKKIEDLRSEANSMDHEYVSKRNRESKLCLDTCKRCVVQKKVKEVLIKQYEHLLPQKETMQFAIVFELQIPEEIACLRDVLCIFAEFCHGEPKPMQIKVKYNDRLTDFNKSSSEHVGLGSTAKPLLNNVSVDSPLKQIIVVNTFNCMYYGHDNVSKKKAIPSTTTILPVKKHCTLEANDEYVGLQWALYSTEHNENKVLASQSKCGTNLTLSEYKNFGTLRSDGHRLQIRKLYAMIETESLSFEKEGVLMLIMQTLWECEVSGEADYVRESHIDFRDAKFCDAMIELLQKFVEQQKNNWVYPFKLLTATLIAVRAFEINVEADLANKIVKLLSSIRKIANEWIRKIETAIRDMANPDENTERNLRLKLIYVSIIGGLTFFIHPTNEWYDNIFSGDLESKEAVRSWLLFIISLTNNIRMYTNNEDQLPSNLYMLIRLIESIGVSLEDKVTEVIERDAEFIFALIKRQWPRAEFAIFSNIGFNHEFSQILDVVATIDGIEQTVTIDIITGTFLVDSLPLSRLPNEVIHSESYQWFFQDVVFEVQPDAQHNFSTKNKYNNCTYEFKMIGNEIIIIERNGNVEKELINQSLFNEHFPYYLVQNYSHWWSKDENCIEFRLRTSGKKHFSKETTVDYCFNIASQHLIHVPTHFPMLYIRSDSYKKITQQLSRLEHAKYIHVLYKEVDDDVSEAKVECVRMNLKFTVECSKKSRAHCDLISNEFKGMRVIRDQNINTLCGLNNGLILQNQDNETKILLIPNGPIEVQIKNTFASVSINNKDKLRNPLFYRYQVDEFCCQLKSSNGSYASWFYLAYLHALTSNGEIERFSGMSGTERAIQILGQSFAWSSEPYEREAVKILRNIANLTPIRELKDDIQSVTWPNNIPTRSAQDCFGFIANKLLDDSQRLHNFYSKNPEKKIELNTSMKLNERDHRRCQQLNPNLNVSNTFIERRVLRTSPPRDDSDRLSDATRTVCMLYHMQKCKIPSNIELKQFLTGKAKSLDGTENIIRINDILNHCTHKEFRDLWIPLYDAAINQRLNSQKFAIILSFYAHRADREEDLKAILALQAIALNPQQFASIKPPVRKSFQIAHGTFVGKTVTAMLKQCHKKPAEYNSREWRDSGQRNRHDMHLETIIDDLTATVKNDWNKSAVSVSFKNKWPEFTDFDFVRANTIVNERLEIWNANRNLYNFIRNVEIRLQTLGGCSIRGTQCIMPQIKPKRWSKMSIDFDAKLNKNYEAFNEQIEEARNIYLMNTSESHRSPSDWWKVFKKMYRSSETIHLFEAGIFPRIVPSLLLPRIMDTNLDENLRCMIGAFGIVITREQRKLRIEAYGKRPDLRAALEAEEENQPHKNWSPREYPEWLLFEIEQNLTIRRIQIEIAKRMIDPPEMDTKHAVMQLNMGEGKTKVIVPILAAKLADRTQACQIIVLKSLFATNLKSLRQYLGGLLNRRIYTFPCRRDMPIESHAHTILDIYEECKREKGVILTLPEYRLSAQLKIYESIALQLKIDEKGNFTTTKNLLDLFNWTNTNVRTILDESDAILQPKYQLIYTVGDQLQPDGNSQRWLVPQALLKRVPFHMNRLYAKYGKEKVEFGQEYDDNRTDLFTPCRILDDIVFEALKDALIDDLFAGRIDIDFPGINESKQPIMKRLLSNKVMDSNARKMIEEFSEENQNIIYILSGLLRFEVLKLALTKRWRVNYGVDVKSTRKMAIPFKAKDVAAEMTEFGHPDVAVCFTQISYYYSGLNEKQLYHVFHLLENSPDASNIYAKWISSIPNELVIPSIKSYNGVNLDDPEQRDAILFPLFKYNMYVIDFWLCNVVYQQELKIFEKKLMCTAWDLCSEKLNHRVTGFSGTNDTKNILPITIAQNDLEELENTNEEMRQILLDPRNRVYDNPANMTGKQILQELHQREISVLLDSGALMLELNNKEVAIEWLKLASGCSAAIYFDENDTLQTIDRDGIVTEFDYSVYREDLSNCVVYLDDVHTRGTDLKFPSDWMACVTLSGDITRDKTVQSCMRMRQLKTTQSILFWASHEADIRLRKLSGQRNVESRHVMEFIEKNSRSFESANMAHWTAGAVNYTEKILGHNVYEDATENENDATKLKHLYEFCVDNDFIELKKMYGEKDEELLYLIAWNKFYELERKYDKLGYDRDEQFIISTKDAVKKKLKTMVPKMKRFTHSSSLDEEQEKELEQEIEEQQQIERPPDAEPAQPVFDRRLQKLVMDGITNDGPFNEMKTDEQLLSIVASLSNTQMSELCKNNEDAWASHLLVTKDFTTVIENLSQACNDFMRPVRWIARIKNPNDKDILILLSSFECNQLIPAFRWSVNATLFMYHPRLSNLHSNLIHETALQLTAMQQTNPIEVNDEVQIGVYAGLMYFSNDDEQRAYCEFLGLVPRPWTQEQRIAHEGGVIEENGYVPIGRRNYVKTVSQCVSQCKFKSNPTDLAIKLIKAHHQMLPKDSHVASILNRGIKSFGEDDSMELE